MHYGITPVLLLITLATVIGQPTRAPHAPGSPDHRPQAVVGEYLVTLAPHAGARAIDKAYGDFGIKRIQNLGHDVYLLVLTRDPGLDGMNKRRSTNRAIIAVQPNYVYRSNGSERAR